MRSSWRTTPISIWWTDYAVTGHWQSSRLWRGAIRDAAVGEARPTRKAAITVPEIVNAVQTQNTVNPAGRLGGEPIPPGQQFAYAVRAQGRLRSPEEFGQIVIRESPDGGIVRVRDVAESSLAPRIIRFQDALTGSQVRSLPSISCLAQTRSTRPTA